MGTFKTPAELRKAANAIQHDLYVKAVNSIADSIRKSNGYGDVPIDFGVIEGLNAVTGNKLQKELDDSGWSLTIMRSPAGDGTAYLSPIED